jgi:hypothetical protein
MYNLNVFSIKNRDKSHQRFQLDKEMKRIFFVSNLVGVHDTESFLELLDGALGEHGEDIAATLLGFPKLR